MIKVWKYNQGYLATTERENTCNDKCRGLQRSVLYNSDVFTQPVQCLIFIFFIDLRFFKAFREIRIVIPAICAACKSCFAVSVVVSAWHELRMVSWRIIKPSTLIHCAASRHTTATVNRSGPSFHGPYYANCFPLQSLWNMTGAPLWQFRLYGCKTSTHQRQFMRCATSRGRGQLSTAPIEFCGEKIHPEASVRNLVVDSAMTFKPHINSVISSCFYQPRQTKSSLKLLPFDTARTVVNSFVIIRIDYCNTLLANSPQITACSESAPAVDECSSATCLPFSSADIRIWSAARYCIGCTCLSESGTSSVFWSSKLSMALHQNISVSSADQTLKTLLVLDSARQHTAISTCHVRRPTLMIMHLQSPGQRHGTDYQRQFSHLTLFRISRKKLTFSSGPFLFLFHSSRARAPLNWTPCYGA